MSSSHSDSLRESPSSAPVAIVAGASRGVGRGVARALAQAGARVVVAARSSEGGPRTEARRETVEDAAREIIAEGGQAYPYRCDCTDEREVDALVSWTLRRFGRVDAAICSVWCGNEGYDGERFSDGSRWGDPYWRRSLERFGPAMKTGVYAGLLLARSVTPAMLAQKRGLIGFVTFDVSVGYLGDVYYDLAKASLARLAFACASELKDTGVTALAVSPGHVRTERVVEAGHAADATETPLYAGRAFAALLADPDVARHAGRTLHAADLARLYGFTDVDGGQPERFSPL